MKPIYDNYEISPCTRTEEPDRPGHFFFEVCEPQVADVWTLYGHIPGEGVEAIGDFSSREHAEEVYYRITGKQFGNHEVNAAADSIDADYQAMQRLYLTYCNENEPADVLPFQEFCEWKAEQDQLMAEQITA